MAQSTPLVPLCNALAAWLENPHVSVSVVSGDEITVLRDENERLKHELAKLRTSYADVASLQLRYSDILREHGIPLK